MGRNDSLIWTCYSVCLIEYRALPWRNVSQADRLQVGARELQSGARVEMLEGDRARHPQHLVNGVHLARRSLLLVLPDAAVDESQPAAHLSPVSGIHDVLLAALTLQDKRVLLVLQLQGGRLPRLSDLDTEHPCLWSGHLWW